MQKPDVGDEVAVSPDHRYIAFYTYQWVSEEGYYDYPSRVYLLDTKENKVAILQNKYHRIGQLLISDDGRLFIMEHTSFNAVYNERRIYISGENTVHCIEII